MLSKARGKRFQLILIKPSHYDADGYVVQWLRSTMPSNSLAAVYNLALGAATRQVLGPDLPIDVAAIDETNTRVRPRDIVKGIASNGGLGLVGFVGVQSKSSPGRSTWRVASAPTVSRCGSAAFTSLAASPCSPRSRLTSKSPTSSASPFSPAKRRKASTRCCKTRPTASFRRPTWYHDTSSLEGKWRAPSGFSSY